MTHRIFFWIFLFSFLYDNELIFAQGNLVSKITFGLNKFVEEYPQEKVFIHTDRSYYLAGETVWFKAYLAAGSFNQLSPLSKTLYVELINEKKEAVLERMIYLNNGVANGDFFLAPSLPSGSYIIRAYTNWMRNFDEAFFFTKEVKIWNLDEDNKRPSSSSGNEPIDLQFFPEGGSLVSGIQTKVAFKAIGPDGLGRQVTGKIFTSTGSFISDIKDSNLGMGLFTFIPKVGESYYAELVNNKSIHYELPRVESTGLSISLINSDEQEQLILKVQTNQLLELPKTLVLAAHHSGELSFIAQISLKSSLYYAKIPKAKLKGGLNHITIFDSNGIPLNSRLAYVDKNEQLKIKLEGLKDSYNPRELVELDIETFDHSGNIVEGFLSLATVNADEAIPSEYDCNIYNYLLLVSDIKGNIELPGYYFDQRNKDRLIKLDILLMTQGWTRFSWSNMLNDRWPAITNYIEQGISIKGQLLNDLNNAPIVDGKVTLFNDSDILVTPTGIDGRFIFDKIIFYDSSNIVLQGENKKGKKFVKFNLETNERQVFNGKTYAIEQNITDFERTLFKNGQERRKIDAAFNFDEKAILLDEVEIKDSKIDTKRDTRVYTAPSKSVKTDKLIGYSYLNHPLEIIRGVAGVRITPNPPGYSVIIRGTGTISGGNSPLILLDNVPVPIETLNTIPTSSIESVDIFSGAEAAIFGSQGGNGVIAFFTRKGNSVSPINSGLYNLNVKGFNVPVEFYAPKYTIKKPEHVKPDRRVTIHWQPNIITTRNGRFRVTYFNPDPESNIQILIQGITKNGLSGFFTTTYRIAK